MPKVHLIGNAHIDPVWLWRWQDGFSETLATFRSAIDRLREFPDTFFTSACAVYYQWIEETDPAMFEEIRTLVKEGRWSIVGGWPLQPDCNIPDGESFMRHALFGGQYFKEKFGVTVKTGYNVDSFGHTAGLPKILRAAGMENYVFMRPSTAEQGNDTHLFWWESDDNSKVLAFRIPFAYGHDCTNIEDKVRAVKDMANAAGHPFMAFYGIGNHGGGPSIALIKKINALDIEDVGYSTPDTYFAAVDKTNLPTIKGELQHHARGCYAAESTIKAATRRCEQNLLAAEAFSVMAKHLVGLSYPAATLKKAWDNLLFNQFHDIAGGCCIKDAFTDASYLFGETMAITERIINTALQQMAWHIDTLQGQQLPGYKTHGHNKGHWVVWEHEVLGTPIIVFNPHPFAVRETVDVFAYASKMTDTHGNEIPFQLIRGPHTNGEDKYHTAFTANVPPLGFAVYRLFVEQKSEKTFAPTLQVSNTVLENNKIRVELDSETGDIGFFYDKVHNKAIISTPCRAVLLNETACDTWAHGKRTLGDVCAQFTATDFSVLENGNVKGAVRVTSRCGDNLLERVYSIIPDSDEIRVDTTVKLREKHRTLKFAFPFDGKTVIAKTAFGTVSRTGYNGEDPCGSWFANSNLAVANVGKYGYDTENGEIRLSVLRSALYADHFGVRDDRLEQMEQNVHTFTYSVFPFTDKANAQRTAALLNNGVRRIMGSFHSGDLPETTSLFACDNDAVIISAVKQHETADTDVIRFYDLAGKETDVTVTVCGKTLTTHLDPYAVKTVDTDGNTLNAMEWLVT